MLGCMVKGARACGWGEAGDPALQSPGTDGGTEVRECSLATDAGGRLDVGVREGERDSGNNGPAC